MAFKLQVKTAKNRDVHTSLFMSYNDLKFIFCTPDNTTRHIFDFRSRK